MPTSKDKTESSAFKKWFGDSRVVDIDGNPLAVYHGSPDVRGIFAEGFRGLSRGSVFFAAADYDIANSYADDHRAFDYQNAEPHTIPLYLSIKNPMVVDAKGQHWRDTERHVKEAKDAGHDGIIITNSVDYYNNPVGKKGRSTTVYAWFEPAQAKSAIQGQLNSRVDGQPLTNATGNHGDFDPLNKDIRASFAGPLAATANAMDLSQAKQRIASGEDAESVRVATGWHQGPDSKWRFEINDSDAKLLPAIKSLVYGGFEPKAIESVTYCLNTDGTYDLTLNPPNPLKTSDFVSLVGVSKDVVDAVLPQELSNAVLAGNGDDDYIGNFQAAKRIRQTFEFDGFNALPLDHVLDHPALFAAYPGLREILVQINPKLGLGAQIVVMEDYKRVIRVGNAKQLSNMLHEIQHGIQMIEGFATGGKMLQTDDIRPSTFAEDIKRLTSQADRLGLGGNAGQELLDEEQNLRASSTILRMESAYKQYRSLAGEVEARNTQTRQTMTDAQRRQTSPQATADVPDSAVIVVFDGEEMLLAPPPLNAQSHQQATTSSAAVRESLVQAYGALFGELEAKDMVALKQTHRDAINEAARARAAINGTSLSSERYTLKKSIKRSQRAWHGSPHVFDKFNLKSIGTGEGAQAYGHGLYFSETKEIAQWYKEKLELANDEVHELAMESIEQAGGDEIQAAKSLRLAMAALDDPNQMMIHLGAALWLEGGKQAVTPGRLYQVEIPDENTFLQWDQPFSKQPALVKKAFRKLSNEYGSYVKSVIKSDDTGEVMYRHLGNFNRNEARVGFGNEDPKTSADLLAVGILGICYLDGVSRDNNEDDKKSKNYVVFDAENVSILDLKHSSNGQLQGFFDPMIGKSFLIADNLSARAAPGVLIHEVGIHMASCAELKPLFERAAHLIQAGQGNPFIDRVSDRLKKANETGAEEAAAYLAEEYEIDRLYAPKTVFQWIKDFKSDVRAWLFGKGVVIHAEDLTVSDIAAVARANLYAASRKSPQVDDESEVQAYERERLRG